MKSSFLLTLVLSALVSFSAMGQTNRTRRVQPKPAVAKPAKPATTSTQTSTQSVATTSAAEKSSFDKFYDRLSIGYFGVFTSPTLEDWDSSNAAISPEWGDTGRSCTKNCDTYAMNVWSQFNIQYDFGWKMKFAILPRWTTHFANPKDMTRSVGEDRAMIGLEDALVGFAGVIYSTDDKKFNWWVRPGIRLPTSHFTRNYEHPQFGSITRQFEALHAFTYDFNPTWQIGMYSQQRIWIYDDRYNPSRFRFYNSPFISYAPRESTKIQLYYEHILENNKRWESINGKTPVFKDYWQSAMLAVGQDITPRLNVMPYLTVFVNDIPLSMRSAFIGAWISYKIK
jgi:hypothetical protein